MPSEQCQYVGIHRACERPLTSPSVSKKHAVGSCMQRDLNTVSRALRISVPP